MTLISNATIISSSKIEKADLLIKDGKIEAIGTNLNANQIIDATGMLLFPGGIDAHTHMELPVSGTFSSDDFASGTKAALFGGTTTIIDFANQSKGLSPLAAIETWHQKAKRKCYTDYTFHISITDLGEKIEQEIDEIINHHGINSFKTFLAYPTMELPLEDLDRLMKIVAVRGGIITNHAEIGATITRLTKPFLDKQDFSHSNHPKIHPEEVETEAIEKVLSLAIKNQCPCYIVHTSTRKGCELITKAKKQFPHIFLETCPQYLLLDQNNYQKDFNEACKYIISPPLRDEHNIAGIWQHIQKSQVDVIATDHCPFTLKQKKVGLYDFTKIPNGAPGVENRFELFYHHAVNCHKIGLNSFVKMIATNPAQIFGLAPKKGDIEIGADADLVLFDPNQEKTISRATHHMNVDYNIFEGTKIKGAIKKVFLKGTLAINEQECLIEQGAGQYLKRDRLKFSNTSPASRPY